jgi:hypothetical protein
MRREHNHTDIGENDFERLTNFISAFSLMEFVIGFNGDSISESENREKIRSIALGQRFIFDPDQNMFSRDISSDQRKEIKCRDKYQSEVSENLPRRSFRDPLGELKNIKFHRRIITLQPGLLKFQWHLLHRGDESTH